MCRGDNRMIRRLISHKGIIVMLLVQLCVCLFWGHEKRGYMCDEIMSYGLANSEDYTFISYSSARNYGADSNGWVDADYFWNYVAVNSEDSFSYDAAIDNQIQDVHPPLYYILLHTVCALTPDRFTKWTGLGMNLLFLLIADGLMYYIVMKAFRRNQFLAIAAILTWSLSAAGLSDFALIRMYMLQTMEILSFVALHFYLFDRRNVDMRVSVWAMLLLCLNVIIGGLTQYYYYFYVSIFSALICLYMLYRRRWRSLVAYAVSLCAGFAINLMLFPATITQVFKGYRGEEVTNNLKARGVGILSEYYLGYVNDALFGGLLTVFAVLLVLYILYRFVSLFVLIRTQRTDGGMTITAERTERQTTIFRLLIPMDRSIGLMLVATVADAGFLYAAAVGSSIYSGRYIYPAFPIIAIWVVCILNAVVRQRRVVAMILTAFCVLSWWKNGIDYTYREYNECADWVWRLEGYDCLLYNTDGWNDLYTNMQQRMYYDETYFFHADEISGLGMALDQRKTKDGVVVCLPDEMSDEEAAQAMAAILESTGYSSYEEAYHYDARVCVLRD